MRKLEKGQAGLAGEYAVMSELILNGFAVGMTGGNSKEIDLLCRDITSGKTTSIQVKTLGPDVEYINRKSGKEHFGFYIGDKTDVAKAEQLKQTIKDKQIYYAFYAAKNKRRTGRVFIATPDEVIKQLDIAIAKQRNKWLYFRIADDISAIDIDREPNYDLSADFEGENGWNKLR
jgi:hypothetical protein